MNAMPGDLEPGVMVVRDYDGLVGRVLGVEPNRNRIAVQWRRGGIISITTSVAVTRIADEREPRP